MRRVALVLGALFLSGAVLAATTAQAKDDKPATPQSEARLDDSKDQGQASADDSNAAGREEAGAEGKGEDNSPPTAKGGNEKPGAHDGDETNGKATGGDGPSSANGKQNRRERLAASADADDAQTHVAGRTNARKADDVSGGQHDPAGKADESSHRVTICHATGSATNPYVEITVDDSALAAHRTHRGGRDIIPAGSGCPGPQRGGTATGGGSKTTICHRTGSASNPWVEITVSDRALPAHSRHGDLIPAPASGCPSGIRGGHSASTQVAPPASPTKPAESDPTTKPHKPDPRTKPHRPGRKHVARLTSQSPTAAKSETGVEGKVREVVVQELPFTGLPLAVIVLFGLASIAAGAALRRRAKRAS